MRLSLLKSKIHRLVVTDANLEYERIDVLNVTNGSRLTTYAIKGERGSRVACANGAAAHHVRPGDVVIVAAWCELSQEEARDHHPTIVLVGKDNQPKEHALATR